MAMQHRGADNFALRDASGKRENYTVGAFRYGIFKDGGFITEGKGWFYNPTFQDKADGGVLNGRSVWVREAGRGRFAFGLRRCFSGLAFRRFP
jgi:hypothetical protein